MRPASHHLAAGGVTAATFSLYLATLSPSVAMWDAGEYVAAAHTLGIPHQPGNPLFLLVARVASMLPLSETIAVRINLLAALCGAVAAGLWFLCAERLLRGSLVDRSHRFVASAAAAGLAATAFTVWNQSVVMEKVYPLALVGLALVSWLVLKWIDTAAERSSDRQLVLIAYVTGLIYAIHPAGLLTGPATALAVILHRPRVLRQWKLLALFVVAFIGGVTPFAVLPIRAAHQPYVNESAISACEDGRIAASCTFSAETAQRLKGAIQREQYGGNAVLARRGPLSAQIGMYWQYFRWQWFRDLDGRFASIQNVIAVATLLLGLAGLVSLRRDARAWYFGSLALTFTVVLVYYLNFRYGWTQRIDLGDLVDREPRDRDYFFMWTFALWGLLAGLGLAALTRAWKPRLAQLVLASSVLLAIGANWRDASRAGQAFTTEWGKDLLASVEPDAILITAGDNDSFPLWYAQSVEEVRRDVTVALTPYLGMDWYPRQLNRRAPIWKLDDEDLDSIPGQYANRDTSYFTHGAIRATIPPRYLTRDQLLVYRAIRDSFPARPIYFSSQAYAVDLGLGAYVKRVGLVVRLMPEAVREDPDTVRLDGGWVDVPRSLRLWRSYRGARQVVSEGRWTDQASANIPLFYAVAGQQLARALESRGRSAEASEVMELAADVVRAVNPMMR